MQRIAIVATLAAGAFAQLTALPSCAVSIQIYPKKQKNIDRLIGVLCMPARPSCLGSRLNRLLGDQLHLYLFGFKIHPAARAGDRERMQCAGGAAYVSLALSTPLSIMPSSPPP